MATVHDFGGRWTDDKLVRLAKYLQAYLHIFKTNVRASFLHTNYVDAFAGTGYRTNEKSSTNDVSDWAPMFIDDTPVYDAELEIFQKGSARIALEMEPSFDRYLFVDKKASHVRALGGLREEFPNLRTRIDIHRGDANTVLQQWRNQVNWRTNRAVVFIDPYGMSVEWTTIAELARTGGVDLWILFPLGQAVNRLLTRDKPPEGDWADCLTRIFGTTEWREAFYQSTRQMNLFGEEEVQIEKIATFDTIGEFFLNRLKSVFPYVADNPLYLRNSKNVPIYLLCFAAANKRGGPIAVKIAQDILGKSTS